MDKKRTTFSGRKVIPKISGDDVAQKAENRHEQQERQPHHVSCPNERIVPSFPGFSVSLVCLNHLIPPLKQILLLGFLKKNISLFVVVDMDLAKHAVVAALDPHFPLSDSHDRLRNHRVTDLDQARPRQV